MWDKNGRIISVETDFGRKSIQGFSPFSRQWLEFERAGLEKCVISNKKLIFS